VLTTSRIWLYIIFERSLTLLGEKMDDLYLALGVKSDASMDQIKASFRSLAHRYHPDRNPENPEFAKVMFQKASNAYKVLGNPLKRQEYDQSRTQEIVNDRHAVAADLWRRYLLSFPGLSNTL
jgi:molecular chaperone DnaJ